MPAPLSLRPMLPAPDEPPPRDLAEAGRAFEALILAQLFRSARASADLMGGRESGAGDGWRDLAERRTAEALAGVSPLGLAQLLARAAPAEDAP
jgi:Rod binding domain-containing protein